MAVPLYIVLPSALGFFGIVWSESGDGLKVIRVLLPSERTSTEHRARVAFEGATRCSHPAIVELGERLQSFLEGEALDFDLSLMALHRCSEFQKRVLLAEHAIPRRWVSTYGRLAKHVGVEGGARAVGRALATNPFPVVIPCHRAIRAGGDLGGYQGGLAMKRTLLAYEGVEVSEKGRVLTDRIYY